MPAPVTIAAYLVATLALALASTALAVALMQRPTESDIDERWSETPDAPTIPTVELPEYPDYSGPSDWWDDDEWHGRYL